LGIKACKIATEMNPIACPLIAFIGTIGVGLSCRKNEELVLAYLIFFFVYTVPSAPIDTIDKHILVDGFLTINIMIGGMWIIANICQIEV
jgi:hypothetical protein